jgi:hypothetical protein
VVVIGRRLSAALLAAAVPRVDVEVISRERMAVIAARLPRVDANRALPASAILSARYWLKVVDIDASAISAEVVKLDFWR